jgi:O-acetyl-ADP-ribose deacetylase (regulator of RNase III)
MQKATELLGFTKLELSLGDLTELDVDVIVNAANTSLRMGGGVAGAIKRKGGIIIEKEAISKAPIRVGSAIVTNAGKLKAKYVIHAAVMALDFKTDLEKIRQATKSALELAEKLKINSIAFPALGTGVGRFPVEESAKIMIATIRKHLANTNTNLKSVMLVLLDKKTYQKFEDILKKRNNHV